MLQIAAEAVRGALAVPVFGRGHVREVAVPELGLTARAVPLPGDRFYAFLDVPAVDAPRAVRVQAGDDDATMHCEPPATPGTVEAEVVVCMATFRPSLDLLARQFDSIRAQTETGWRCVISDDGSPPETLDAIRAMIDERFVLIVGPHLGFYRNFEHALEQVGPATRYVALADQDDHWRPDKLAVLAEALERSGAELAYSDCRVVDSGGRVLRDSFYSPRRNNPDDLRALLLANSAPGASMLVRRELIHRALPFPVPFGLAFHDHWLAVLARAGGGLEFVADTLWDYVQHGANVAGHQTAQASGRRGWAGRYGRVYRDDLLRVLSLAGTLELRAAASLTPADRATIRALREIETDRGAQAALIAHGLRARADPAAAPTAAIELDLALAMMWRRFRA